MAIKHVATTAGKRSVEGDMTVEEFKEWLSRFDVNNDGRISREELRQAISSINVRFSGWKSGRGLRYADTDGDGYIDAGEVDNLVEFARRSLGIRIVS